MNEERSDFELLQAFVRHGEQPAFTRLVRRHLDLVYATALRKLGQPEAAQEVAQNTFAVLARKAWQFAPDDSLPAWLYKTTLLASREWLRGELRRRRREQTAAELGTTMNPPGDEPALRALVPLLDEALLSLREKDRSALLLRFYENRSLRDVGKALNLTEDTAQKRVATALDKVALFFQRRGYKTATVALSAAALTRTAQAAPAAVAHALALAAEQMAPPALPGLASLAARLAGWTKVQTAATCLLLVGVPIIWQLHQIHQSRREITRLQNQIFTDESTQTALQAEIDRLGDSLAQLKATAAESKQTQARQAEARRKYEVWRAHVRTELLADDYRWPEDSPFVRIPKAVIRQVDVSPVIALPGTLSQPARELLGLAPEEREQIEEALHTYYASLDSLMENNIQETNSLPDCTIPASATASQCWSLPALGKKLKDQGDTLQTALQNALGAERWPIVQEYLLSSGTDGLRQILNLDSAEHEQHLAVWIAPVNGNPAVGYQWSGHSYSESSSGTPLKYFIPDHQQAENSTNQPYVRLRNSPSVPQELRECALRWIAKQAALVPGKETPP